MGGSYLFWIFEAVRDDIPITDEWMELTSLAFGRHPAAIRQDLRNQREVEAEVQAERAAEAARKEAP